MGGPREYYAKWSKPDREGQVSWYRLHVESNRKKKTQMNLLPKQRLTDTENKLMVTKGESGVGEGIN